MAADSSSPPAPAAPTRRVVVVLGMHRSGTSAVAGCLQRLGVDFGPRLMPATDANARGYYEHIDLVNVHDRLLLALGRSWDDPSSFPPSWWLDQSVTGRYRDEILALLRRDFPTAPIWGFKDPRLCRLLPWWETLWREMNSEPLFVLVRRAPSEVAASLAKREGFSAAKSHLLWLQHTLEAERFTRAHARVLIDFTEFLDNSQRVLADVERALGSPWPIPPSASGEMAHGPFVEPALARAALAAALPDSLPLWVREADAALRSGLAGREDEMRVGLDRIASNVQAAESLYVAPPSEAVADLQHQLEASRRQAVWYEAEWQKARARAEDARAQLITRKQEVARLKSRRLTIDNSKSNMINKNISNLIKKRVLGLAKIFRRSPND